VPRRIQIPMKKLFHSAKDAVLGIDWKSQTAAFLAFLAVVVTYQHLGAAYECEFGAHPDEAAHYVTGLMIRDYLADGIPGHPMRFAEDYYDHYPKVALGNWPPFFYLIQAAWTLPFTPSRASVLLLMASLTAALALLIWNALRKDFGPLLAAFGSMLFLSLPLIQKYSSLVMTEIPIALLAFVAALCFGRYIEDGKTSRSIFFGLFASAAILTKGSGLYLAFVPPITLILCRRFDLLKRIPFWASAVIVAVLCAPWTLFTLDKAKAGWEHGSVSWDFTSQAIPYYATKLFLAVGIAALALAAIGVAVRLIGPAKAGDTQGKWAATGALMFSVFALQPLIPCGFEPRHLVMALPPLIMFAIAGAAWNIERLQRRLNPFQSFAFVVTVSTVLFLIHPFELKRKGYEGFEDAARLIVSNPDYADVIVFVSSDASGEGMLISEVAMREKRVGHTVRRASKLLGQSNWSGSEYESKFSDTDAIVELLRKEGIRLLVIDNSMREQKRVAHHDLLEKALVERPETFKLVAQSDTRRIDRVHPGAVRVFEFLPGQ